MREYTRENDPGKQTEVTNLPSELNESLIVLEYEYIHEVLIV